MLLMSIALHSEYNSWDKNVLTISYANWCFIKIPQVLECILQAVLFQHRKLGVTDVVLLKALNF